MSFTESEVAVIDDAITPEMAVAVMREIQACGGFSFGWHSNKGFDFSHWNLNFGGSKKARKDALRAMPPSVQAISAEFDPKLEGYRLIRAYVNAMTFGTEGYPHTDSQIRSDVTAVIYLNPDWRMEWAGETVMFDDENEIVKSVLPKFCRAVLFPGAMMHAARGVSRICPECRYVLVLKYAIED